MARYSKKRIGDQELVAGTVRSGTPFPDQCLAVTYTSGGACFNVCSASGRAVSTLPRAIRLPDDTEGWTNSETLYAVSGDAAASDLTDKGVFVTNSSLAQVWGCSVAYVKNMKAKGLLGWIHWIPCDAKNRIGLSVTSSIDNFCNVVSSSLTASRDESWKNLK